MVRERGLRGLQVRLSPLGCWRSWVQIPPEVSRNKFPWSLGSETEGSCTLSGMSFGSWKSQKEKSTWFLSGQNSMRNLPRKLSLALGVALLPTTPVGRRYVEWATEPSWECHDYDEASSRQQNDETNLL